MNRLYLKVPKKDEYSYRKHMLEDPNTMDYNAGWEVSYDGYNYYDGTIKFNINNWNKLCDNINKDNFFAYIMKKDDNTYIGSVNYHYNKNDDRYEIGIVIEGKNRKLGYSKEALSLLCNVAFNNGIDKLYDNFEKDRIIANKIFFDLGFKVEKEEKYIRFKKEIDGYLVSLERNDFNGYK